MDELTHLEQDMNSANERLKKLLTNPNPNMNKVKAQRALCARKAEQLAEHDPKKRKIWNNYARNIKRELRN